MFRLRVGRKNKKGTSAQKVKYLDFSTLSYFIYLSGIHFYFSRADQCILLGRRKQKIMFLLQSFNGTNRRKVSPHWTLFQKKNCIKWPVTNIFLISLFVNLKENFATPGSQFFIKLIHIKKYKTVKTHN